MSKGKLKPEDEKCIQRSYTHLKENLDASRLVDLLYQYEVITLDDKQNIMKIQSLKDQNEKLLDLLLHSGPDESFNKFLKCLEFEYKSVLKYMGRKAEDLKNEKSLEEENIKLKATNEELSATLKIFQANVVKLQKQIELTESELRKCENEMRRHKTEKDELVKKMEEKNEIIGKFKEDCAQLVKEKASQEEKNSRQVEEIDDLAKTLEIQKCKFIKLTKENDLLVKSIKEQKEVMALFNTDIALKRSRNTRNINGRVLIPDSETQEIPDMETIGACNYQEFVSDYSDRSEVDFDESSLLGQLEQQLSIGGEPDLYKHMDDCDKNPGHKQFIPVDKFTIEHLPEGHRDKDLFEMIRAGADLTVRISVTMISRDRPEVWPRTKVPYPLFNMKDSGNILRTGSGRVLEVENKSDEKCVCGDCRWSNKPSLDWCEVKVLTAASLVFDYIEAQYLTIRLFYDKINCPVVILKDVVAVDVNIERDICVLTFATCDKKLGKKLMTLNIHFNDALVKICGKYNEPRSKAGLMFIVSHPHGCYKRVSVGHWNDKFKVHSGDKFTYTTSTCPGSTGASVYFLGYDWYVHGGCLKSGLNYNCV